MSSKSELDELRAEIERQKVLLKTLSDQINPPKSEPWVWQRPDYTEGMSMSRSAMQAMIDAVPASVMADIRGDARRPNPVTSGSSPITSSNSSAPSQPQRNTGGWRESAPLGPPPGIEHADRLVDAQDRIDKTELAERLAKAAAIEQAAKEAGK